eukprot:2469830-Pleurochrysis_carterae.AAC.2
MDAHICYEIKPAADTMRYKIIVPGVLVLRPLKRVELELTLPAERYDGREWRKERQEHIVEENNKERKSDFPYQYRPFNNC